MTVRELRRRWKATKERLSSSARHEPLLIRIHRACSWLQRVEELPPDVLDDRLVLQWVSLNSLYGQWNEERREPQPDKLILPQFLDRILGLDSEQRVAQIIADERQLVLSIFEDAYLTKFFWENPSEIQAKKAMSTRHKAKSWYVEGKTGLILARVMERIYLLRCQLVHGAATHGGKLNRSAIHQCSAMLEHLMTAILLIIIDHGADEDWGALCYPPYPCGE